MSGIIAGLAGAGGAAANTGSYYQNAMSNDLSATGSPAAQQFGQSEMQALQPQFNQQDSQLAAKESAMGITNSGAAKADYGNLAADQAAILAGKEGGLYSQALGNYGQINAAMPGAQNNAYQQAIQNFYTGISDAGSMAAGLPPMGQPQPAGGALYSGASSGGYGPVAGPDPYGANNYAGSSNPYGYG